MSRPVEGGGDPRVGTTIASRYFLHRLLGRGGMGDVYEATRLADDRPVALKLLRATGDEERLRRFEREAALAGRLRHAGCVEVVESGRDAAAGLFLAMELVRGRDLARVLAEEGPLAAARAGRIADQVLGVLAAAHAAGIVHRDLKPANVMIEDGDGERVKVLDFGIATFLDARPGEPALTREGVAQGTPAYMSPEQIRGEPLDARCDLYSAGALLFEMLAGVPPFEAPSPMAIAARQLTEPAPSLAARRTDVPAALAALVARALDADRSRRPPSAEAMRAELRDALSAVHDAGAPPRRPLPPTEAFAALAAAPGTRRRAWTAVVGSALAVAAAALVVAIPALRRGAGAVPATAAAPAAPLPADVAAIPGFRSDAGPAPATAPLPAVVQPASPGAPPVVAAVVVGPPPARRHAPPAPPSPRVEPSASQVLAGQGGPIRLVRGELNAVPTPAAETGDGVLVLQASPWALVSVAGVELGETPRELRVAAGSYDVRGVHPELGVRAERVTVRAGERTLWSIAFEE